LLILVPASDGRISAAPLVIRTVVEPIPSHQRSSSNIVVSPRSDDFEYVLFSGDEIIMLKPWKTC
jgi:hypothetical protein